MTLYCGRCRKEVPPKSKKCPFCAANLLPIKKSSLPSSVLPASTKKSKLPLVISLVLVILAAIILVTTLSRPAPARTLSTYKQSVYTSFMSGCMAQSGQQFSYYCSCVANKVVDNLTESELQITLEKYNKTHLLSPELQNFIQKCK